MKCLAVTYGRSIYIDNLYRLPEPHDSCDVSPGNRCVTLNSQVGTVHNVDYCICTALHYCTVWTTNTQASKHKCQQHVTG